PTGKKIAVIGGGPAGLTCAYFLALMGHKVVLYERHKALGGMLRYGIPNYRFPKDILDEDLNAILSAGDIEVKYGVNVGKDVSVSDIRKEHDAIFVAIGAQNGKKLRIDGVDAGNVESAVEMLDKIGNGDIPDYTGKTVAIIGGGNVAMDAARSAVRCNAKDVRIVYRRRQNDMTALESEIESAVMEGIELMTLQAPKSIEKDENGNCAALFVQPQMIGQYDAAGRPSPIDANKEQVRIPCDVVLIAVGQDVVSKPFEEFGMPASRGIFTAGLDTAVEDLPGVFVGGDCATGPATAIRAIAAGKVAAHNIDEYLGYHHKLHCDVEIPQARDNNRTPTGRANITERPAYIRKHDFEHVENPLTFEEAMQEAGRCLRCDHFGCGVLKGGTDQ
ncbi:MAG: FAD-dependent oxidoreductase, partial [Oscillospiraceae bacterium]|nr:FAD-dependent oxidoreductase [Oscillospiraceae bacterium]